MEYLSYRANDKVGMITINNDKQRNALSLPVIREFKSLLHQIGKDREVHVLVIAADGKIFSSGHNLREIDGTPAEAIAGLFDECQQFMQLLRDIPQVTIAKVHSMATAAGCQLVAACDLAVASEQATFATPGVHIGLFCSTPAVFISRNVGRKKAAEMLFTGDSITAQEALVAGLVNHVVPHEQLDSAAEELARRIARHALSTLEIGKREFYKQLNMEDFEALSYASQVISLNALHSDAKEGIRAFIEKRPAKWRV
ncbi:enoyl-CoA hydratase [Aneurinibacillus sp. Ricciae_BoGa-3]|uniref:enoyl-CoA hydratase n=1 Tax=Aneurinibacillus sp. Ricciae_BoGa-3 TaxID=3022697 RepID=UPI002341091D|nr:enoyl-CoA hydratase [Aneurinibacillus sp. Ricciae_BoGa-3]WCK52708.1 enoyl-CoA hydratase [Aneurinibacillus sp. Ricciae_BoGa-3]